MYIDARLTNEGLSMRVYNLVGATHGVSNLSLRRLKVSRFSKLNDPFELLAADLLDRRDKTALEKMKEQLDQSSAIICFSESWHSPLLWGHYAESHTGIALGFDVPDDYLIKVKYTTNRPKINFDTTTRKVIDGQAVVERLISTKFSHWEYENEQRMFVKLDDTYDESGNHFVDFGERLQLREVILGVKCSLPIERVRKLVEREMPPVKVMKAGMALRTFRVIEDRTQRP
jgi:Protein of unknown function (DUF2971)